MTRWILLALLAVTLACPSARADQAQIALILDASGSMWGQIEGENKIVIARRVLKDLVKTVPADTHVGLVAYGHRKKSACDDIEIVVPFGSTDRNAILRKIDGINPKGMTPITATLTKVFTELREREAATTVILVSDGLETCGGDPCQAVRDAKAAGIEFVMHVVGFDLGDEDAAQLECAARAGGGLYLTANSAAELGKALEQAIEIIPETPTGRLSVTTMAEGELIDTTVAVIDAASGEVVTALRTYENEKTNPIVIPLPDGKYDISVEAVRIAGRPTQKFTGIEIAADKPVEKIVDFSTGTFRVKVTRNGALSDALVEFYAAGTSTSVVNSRTYRDATSNPRDKRITAGSYDIEAKALEIANHPVKRWERVALGGGEVLELEHEFVSGTLTIGAKRGAELIDVTVAVAAATTGTSVAVGRTYTRAESNPRSFVLSPGRYKVTLKPVKLDIPPRTLEVEVAGAAKVEKVVDFAAEN